MPHHSNLESFLSRTTPSVRSQFLPKRCPHDVNLHSQHLEYFNLGDLWDGYDEWSAYGLGSPILLDSGETVVQYYTPSLSAMEVYTNKSVNSRCFGDEYDGEYETDYSSSENECGMLSRSSSSSSDKTWELEDSGNDLMSYWPPKNRLGHLYCQYVEEEKPYWRTPLAEKINELAKKYPGLKSFKSVDLSPASWMAVAWYPIYVIPALRNPKQVFASFLTYHTISSLFQDNIFGYVGGDVSCTEAGKGEVKGKGESNCISLPSFGLATYKMQSRVWINPETADCQRIASLLNGADSWLKQLQFHHHDYDYFRTHSISM